VIAISGPWSELHRVVGVPARIRDSRWRLGLVQAAMEGAQGALAEGFATETDPYGRRWQPSLRAELESGQTLSDTGRLRRSFRWRAQPDGFWLGTNVIYAAAHQYGAVIRPKHGRYLMVPVLGRRGRGRARPVEWRRVREVVLPVRQMVPEGDLGPRWAGAIQRSANAYIRRTLR